MHQCPSAPAKQGTTLFGLVDQEGQVVLHDKGVPVSKQLLLHLPVTAEHEFRFAAPCVRSGCVRWNDECSLAAKLSEFQVFSHSETLEQPACPIQSSCRWLAQVGPSICSICLTVSRVPEPWANNDEDRQIVLWRTWLDG